MPLVAYRYRVIVENSVGVSGKSLNVFNVGSDALVSDANVTLMLGDLKTFYTAIATYVYGTYSIGARVLEYQAAGGPPRIVTVAPVAQVSAASASLPPQLSVVVAWRTALAGKSYRGRTFLGPLNGAAQAGGAVTAAAQTAVNTAAANLITNLKPRTTGSVGLVVHSDHANVDTPVVVGATDLRMDTMRSRS